MKLKEKLADETQESTPQREHEESESCWCEPEVAYVDPESGCKVFVHKELQ